MSVRISSSVAPPAAVRTMKPPGKRRALRRTKRVTRTIFRAVDFARDADVVDRRHVDKEAAQAERRGW